MDPRPLPPRLVIDPTLHPEISVELRSSPHILRLARSGVRVDTTKNPALLFVIPALLMVIAVATGMTALLVPVWGSG